MRLNAATGRVTRRIGLGKGLGGGVAVTADGRRAVVGSARGAAVTAIQAGLKIHPGGTAALTSRGHYPINHLVVVKDELLATHPDLAASVYEAFAEAKNVFDPGVAAKMRQFILAPGNSTDRTEAYRQFRGRDPDVAALLKKRGFPTSPTK